MKTYLTRQSEVKIIPLPLTPQFVNAIKEILEVPDQPHCLTRENLCLVVDANGHKSYIKEKDIPEHYIEIDYMTRKEYEAQLHKDIENSRLSYEDLYKKWEDAVRLNEEQDRNWAKLKQKVGELEQTNSQLIKMANEEEDKAVFWEEKATVCGNDLQHTKDNYKAYIDSIHNKLTLLVRAFAPELESQMPLRIELIVDKVLIAYGSWLQERERDRKTISRLESELEQCRAEKETEVELFDKKPKTSGRPRRNDGGRQ